MPYTLILRFDYEITLKRILSTDLFFWQNQCQAPVKTFKIGYKLDNPFRLRPV